MALDPIYTTDDYPREGCRLVIDVQKDGYRLAVFAPNGAPMESYAVAKTARGIARMLEEWGNGYAPRITGRLDQPSSLPWAKS